MADKDRDARAEQADHHEEQQPVEGTLEEAGAVEGDGEAVDVSRVQELEEKLQAAEAKAEENWNQYLRTRAEMENARRRLQKDVEQAKRQGLEKLAAEMLPVKDSLEMGLSAAGEANADVAKLSEGTELTLKMLTQALEKFEVSEIDPMGQKFDPERHEAMATQPSAEHEPNTVIHVVQKGYMLNDRLLRPAMVIVSKVADQQQGGPTDEQA